MAFTGTKLWLSALAGAALLTVAGCGQESQDQGRGEPVPAAPTTEPGAGGAGESETPDETEPSATESSAGGTGGDVERPDASKTPDEPDRCHSGGLTGSIEQLDSAAGNRYANLVLANEGSEPCAIYGYGGLELVDDEGTALPTRLERVADPAPTLVELEPGAAATKLLHWGVVPGDEDDPEGDCGTEATSIRVIPPDETDPLTVDWGLGPVCQGGKIDGSAYVAR
ncbi:DUF4232 domain-containing protein [Actinoalloteichus hymeniacidonis]|uniref:DUF4232 family protein n=1 Tax=Actinoalloteichus hymeniacidonis TaxID=340345 RepID=A0AAC9HUU8_9PSEU|nr:DUF4232 domain-containing protein [Actinoalloteichus hymeniacidonis]AOS65784.1 putative DUF4232 family protein [Actinoalloteichus hymeniacidonis]MBB5906125.1 hypothetical protein [Actinoalloteichus hymeniacidonis]